MDNVNLLPPGRPPINLDRLLTRRVHPQKGRNDCVCVSLAEPQLETRKALCNGLRRILPFMYRMTEDVFATLCLHGMDFPQAVPLPDSFSFQWAHTGEILVCAYFEECEGHVVLTYKWRLSTAKNQHQFGMDLIAFNLNPTPPVIYAIAVKTTDQGRDGKTPSVIYDAIRELRDYLGNDRLDDDLEIIAANLHTDEVHRRMFLDWYDPYTQGVPADKPCLVAVPAIVIEAQNWDDKYAKPAIDCDFGIPGSVRILCLHNLENLVRLVYSQGGSR